MVDVLVRAGAAIDTADVSGLFYVVFIQSYIIQQQI